MQLLFKSPVQVLQLLWQLMQVLSISFPKWVDGHVGLHELSDGCKYVVESQEEQVVLEYPEHDLHELWQHLLGANPDKWYPF